MIGLAWWRRLRIFPAGLLSLAMGLAGCQAVSVDEGLSVAASAAQAVTSSTHGDGPVLVTMLLPEDAGMRTKARDLADGAKLALDDLGAGQIRIDFQPTGSADGQAAMKVQAAAASGARLIIGPATHSQLRSIVSATSGSRPPMLALAAGKPAGGKHIWPLYQDAIDSALEGVRVPISSGQKAIVVLHDSGLAASDLQRLRDGIREKGGTALGFVAYPQSAADLRAAFEKQRTVLAKANAVVVLGNGEVTADVLDLLATGEFVQKTASTVASSALSERIYHRPSARGVIIAMPSTADFDLIAQRFKTKYGRNLGYDAAIGYDAIAIPAGLVRAGGSDAITVENLMSRRGFRAATGLFRFLPDGRIERRMIAHRIENGSLKAIQTDGAGF